MYTGCPNPMTPDDIISYPVGTLFWEPSGGQDLWEYFETGSWWVLLGTESLAQDVEGYEYIIIFFHSREGERKELLPALAWPLFARLEVPHVG